MKRIYLRIKKENAHYVGWIHRGEPRYGTQLKGALKVGPQATIENYGESHSLGELVGALRHHHPDDLAFDTRTQLAIGHHLFAETLGKIAKHHEPRDLIVETQEEDIAALPWPLLARNDAFLVADGWTVSLAARGIHHPFVELPPNPKFLLAVPEPDGVSRTEASAHREELRNLLAEGGTHMVGENRFRVVSSWDDFREEIESFRPNVVYFYGHGEGTRKHCRLIFEDRGNLPLPVRMEDVAEVVRSCQPQLVYLNCCSGDAAGILGAGRQLGNTVPAVVTNRTVATIAAARSQARALWEEILLRGKPPHLAVARNYQRLGDVGLSRATPHWFTPVIHVHYDVWKAHPPRSSGTRHDPHWYLKVDRLQQFSMVSHMTQEMLREGKPAGIAFLWYGKEGQGLELFGKRLGIQLRDYLHPAQFYTVYPSWPDYADDNDLLLTQRGFEDMICDAFEVDQIEAVPARIRGHTRGNRALVYLDHAAICAPGLLPIPRLKHYLDWLGNVLVPKLGRSIQFALVGLSFQVRKPEAFRRLIDRLDPAALVFRPLPELKNLGLRDLKDFLRTHNIYIPDDFVGPLLAKILEKTGGKYEITLSELEKLIQGYTYHGKQGKNGTGGVGEEDYF